MSADADLAARADALLGRVEELADPVAREVALDAVTALVALYGEALGRIAARVGVGALAGDELVEQLLLVHGLHPTPVVERVTAALDSVRPYLRSHGGDVELLGVQDGIARVRMVGSCHGCPSSAVTLRLAVEDAVRAAAPDVERVEADGAAAAEPHGPPPGLVALPMAAPASEPRDPWAVAGGLPALHAGGTLLREVAGAPVLFCAADGDTLAYRPACPACGASLGDAALRGDELRCAGCGHRYDVRRAGRCLDEPALHLHPIPLLVGDSGVVKVALG